MSPWAVYDCEVRPDAEKSELPCTTVPETVEGRGNRMLPGAQSVVCCKVCENLLDEIFDVHSFCHSTSSLKCTDATQ